MFFKQKFKYSSTNIDVVFILSILWDKRLQAFRNNKS